MEEPDPKTPALTPSLSNAAIGSVGLAILGIFAFGVVAGPAAVVLGFVAKNQIDKGVYRGIRLALAGIWGGLAVTGLSLLLMVAEPEQPSGLGPAPVQTWPAFAQYVVEKVFGYFE